MSKWDGIDEFLAVAATSSFTGAARIIGMSPTHVSRSIIALEQRLQAQLFYRTTRTVRLTDTGRVFLERCQRIAQERDEAIALIGERGEPQGELRVTCSTAMGERFVVPIIRRFATQHSKLNVTIELTNRVIDLIGEGYDLAVRTGTISDPRLITRRVASRTLYTCAAPEYLARAGTPRSVEELVSHECIAGTSDTWHFEVGGQEILHRVRGRFRCNSGQAVIEASVSGLGICQLPDFYILPYLQQGLVTLVLEDLRPADEPVWAVYPQRRHLVPKVEHVVEALEVELAEALNGPVPIGQA
jgi:DNA-binding transcriptional LysR family regulator